MSARKSIVSILSLTILCIAAAWAIGVQAVWAEDEPAEIVAYPVTGGNIYFHKWSGTIFDCDKSVTSAIIPETIEGETIREVEPAAFSQCQNLRRVELPDSITDIKLHAFSGCSNLAFIKLPNNLQTIGGAAFWNCDSLTNIKIPDTVKDIEELAFAECDNLRHVDLSNGLINIEKQVFIRCTNLHEIVLPNQITTIKESTFDGCKSLTNIVLPKQLVNIERTAFLKCESLTTVKIPEGTKTIGDDAFFGCQNLRKANIPSSLREIGAGAFQQCSKLKSITIPNSVVQIGKYAIDPSDELHPNGIPDFIIYGYSSTSAAAKYAKSNGFTYTNLNAPKKISGLVLKSGKKGMTVSWKKSAGASGYELLYASNKNFKSSRKVTTAGTKKTIKNLKSGKTYYVKVRAYRKADGETHYSDYCTAKQVKIK